MSDDEQQIRYTEKFYDEAMRAAEQEMLKFSPPWCRAVDCTRLSTTRSTVA
jgi:hypothetical protein